MLLSQMSVTRDQRGYKMKRGQKKKPLLYKFLAEFSKRQQVVGHPNQKGGTPLFFCPILSQKGLNLNDKRN